MQIRKPVRLPKIRRRHVPKKPKKFLNGKKLLERVGEIWNIPIEDIRPEVRYLPKKDKQISRSFGKYSSETHLLTMQNRLSRKNWKSVKSHELIHAADHLVRKKAVVDKPSKTKNMLQMSVTNARDAAIATLMTLGLYPKTFQERVKEEILADLSTRKIGGTRFNYLAAASASASFTVVVFGWLLSAKNVGRVVEMLASPIPVKKIFDRHGQDGIILFLVKPPKTFGAAETLWWERKMRKQGYLKDKGGITEKGLGLLRTEMPRQKILVRIKRMEENRERQEKKKLEH